jgi:hypothetical protein
VFSTETTITAAGSTATFVAEKNHSVVNTLKFFIRGEGLTAVQEQGDSTVIYLLNNIKGKNDIKVTALDAGKNLSKTIELNNKVLKVSIRGGELLVEEAAGFPGSVEDITEGIVEIKGGCFVASSHRSAPPVFDLQGRQLSKSASHGVYVQQGKKMVR